MTVSSSKKYRPMICLLDIAHHICIQNKSQRYCRFKEERIKQEIKAIKLKERLKNVFDGIVRRLKFCINVNDDTFEQRICRNF